jgi:hypothetical protein
VHYFIYKYINVDIESTSRLQYLYKNKSFRKIERNVVYIDETCVHSNDSSTFGFKKALAEEKILIYNCIWRWQGSQVDMNGLEKLILSLPPKSVVVMNTT